MKRLRFGLLAVVFLALTIGANASAYAGRTATGLGNGPILNAGQAAAQTAATGLPLAANELMALQSRQAQDSGLSAESGAGCKMVRYWDKHLQHYEYGCDRPGPYMVLFGSVGALFGYTATFPYTASGAVAGAVLGAGFGYLLYRTN